MESVLNERSRSLLLSSRGLKQQLWESLTVNLISVCSKLLKHFILLTFCRLKTLESVFCGRSLSLPLRRVFKTITLKKSSWWISLVFTVNLLKIISFLFFFGWYKTLNRVLYVQKELIIATFVERFKTTTLQISVLKQQLQSLSQ